jgi:hypothetical protein
MGTLLKRWYVWLGLVLLLGLAGSVMLIYSSRSRITQANFDRIQVGMTFREVDKLLSRDNEESQDDVGPLDVSATWYDDPNGLTIVVQFDEQGKAISKTLIPAEPFRTLRRRLTGHSAYPSTQRQSRP